MKRQPGDRITVARPTDTALHAEHAGSSTSALSEETPMSKFDQHPRWEVGGGAMRSLILRAAVAAGVTALVVAAWAGAAAASPLALRPLAFPPSGHNFGPVTVGQTAQQKFTLKNTSSTTSSRLTVSHAGSARFSITAD